MSLTALSPLVSKTAWGLVMTFLATLAASFPLFLSWPVNDFKKELNLAPGSLLAFPLCRQRWHQQSICLRAEKNCSFEKIPVIQGTKLIYPSSCWRGHRGCWSPLCRLWWHQQWQRWHQIWPLLKEGHKGHDFPPFLMSWLFPCCSYVCQMATGQEEMEAACQLMEAPQRLLYKKM